MPKTISVLIRCPDRDPFCTERHYAEVLAAESAVEIASFNSSNPYYGEFANSALLAILERVQELEEEVQKLKEGLHGNL